MDVFFSEFPSVAVPHFKGFNVSAFWQLRFNIQAHPQTSQKFFGFFFSISLSNIAGFDIDFLKFSIALNQFAKHLVRSSFTLCETNKNKDGGSLMKTVTSCDITEVIYNKSISFWKAG